MSRTSSQSGKFDGEDSFAVKDAPSFRFDADHMAEAFGYEIYLYVVTGGCNADSLSHFIGVTGLAVTDGDIFRAFDTVLNERSNQTCEIIELAQLLSRGAGNTLERFTPAEIYVACTSDGKVLCSTKAYANPLHVARLVAYHMLGHDVPPDMRTLLSKLPRVKR